MAYDLATVTNQGNKLLASVISDRSSLVIDKIEVSGTQLASSTDLKSMTSISNVVTTLSANGYQKKDSSFIISTVLDNSSITADYQAWVFGIWAHETDGGSPILMSVITSTNSPDTISKGSGTPIDYNYKFITTFSNTDSLTIKMSSDTYATNDTVLHNSGDETATGTKTFQEIKISNDKFPSLVQTDGQYITLDGGNSEIVPADNSKVVHTTGDETIDGQKKFKTDPTDSAGNAYAKTVDVNQQLDKKVNIADMRKPASDVAGIEEVNAKQDKIGYTPADDSKVVHDNHDGTLSINGNSFTPSMLDSAINKNSQPIDTDVDTLAKPKLYYVSRSAPNNPFKARMMLENRLQYDWNLFREIQIAYKIGSESGIAIRCAYPNNNLTSVGGASPWMFLSDDSKVAHLSGANNFDTVPTVNNNPLLLASSLPSDLARTGSDQEFTGKNTFDTAPIDKTTGNPYITKDGVPSDVAQTGQAQTFTAAQTFSIAPTIKDASKDKGDNQAATMADLKSVEKSAWRQLDQKNLNLGGTLLYKIDQNSKRIYMSYEAQYGAVVKSNSTIADFSSIVKNIKTISGKFYGELANGYDYSGINGSLSNLSIGSPASIMIGSMHEDNTSDNVGFFYGSYFTYDSLVNN